MIHRIVAWAFGVWSPSALIAGCPPYYSLRGALRGHRDAWAPPRWALDERSPAFTPREPIAVDMGRAVRGEL